MRSLLLCLVLAACGTSTQGMSGPTISGRLDDRTEAEPEIQSNDILSRDMVTPKAVVRHVLVGWRDLAKAYPDGMDPRARERSREDADALAVKVLARVRAGEDMVALMKEVSEDRGSATTGKPYDVTVDGGLVFEFKRLSLRLKVGEAGLVKTSFGWHIIKRFE